MLKILRYITVLTLVLTLINTFTLGQISSGGFPLKVQMEKSAASNFVQLPKIMQSKIDDANERNTNAAGLKPFKFAIPHPVNYSPDNSGQWYSTNANYNIWKLTISSSGAKSLNLIFDEFKLREGARLYIYNEKEDHYLGAFTSYNNKASGKFAVSPVRGEEITIQYEVPENLGTPTDFKVIKVNHDFIGVTSLGRRPLGPAGSCNIDVNCEIGEDYFYLKNSVCRLIVDGEELCTGTLINNTAEDMKPYILSAWHCYDEWEFAETTVYSFNYESPYCAPLDGDPVHSISGAVMKAHYDSLDLALVEMSLVPPPDFRPYYAGWNNSGSIPDSSVSIHHPLADIKKIAFDNDPAEYATFTSSSVKNPKNGSFKIKRWDDGVTEIGSSGGGLFNTQKQLIGTLSGGAAICGNPIDDYFARFDKQWNYKSDSTQQLMYWLDPIGTGAATLEGNRFYTDENLCKAFTNLNDEDEHGIVQLTTGGNFVGYWGGTNNVGIEEIVERFSIAGDESLKGVSLGVGKIDKQSVQKSELRITVYNGNSKPESLIYDHLIDIEELVEGAMNFIAFDEDVQPGETFYVGIDVENIQAQDTFVLYQSLRESGDENNFLYSLGGTWTDFELDDNSALTNVMELVACNYDDFPSDTPVVDTPTSVRIYPNPTHGQLTLQSDQVITIETVSIFNLIGQEINAPLLSVGDYELQFDISGNTPGIYIVRFNYNDSFVTRKFSLVPY